MKSHIIWCARGVRRTIGGGSTIPVKNENKNQLQYINAYAAAAHNIRIVFDLHCVHARINLQIFNIRQCRQQYLYWFFSVRRSRPLYDNISVRAKHLCVFVVCVASHETLNVFFDKFTFRCMSRRCVGESNSVLATSHKATRIYIHTFCTVFISHFVCHRVHFSQ